MKHVAISCIIWCLASVSIYGQKAQEPVRIEIHSYQKTYLKDKQGKVKKDKSGRPIIKWVKVGKAVPGTIIKYVDTVINDLNETITDVKVINPIHKSLSFIKGSITSNAKVTATFSVDGGKHFAKPEALYIIENKKKRLAKPSEYNAVMFVVDKVPAHGNVNVSYLTKIK